MFTFGEFWGSLCTSIFENSSPGANDTFRLMTIFCRRFFSCLLILLLTHLSPMHPFCTPWKHQKTISFSDVFSWLRKDALGTNGLIDRVVYQMNWCSLLKILCIITEFLWIWFVSFACFLISVLIVPVLLCLDYIFIIPALYLFSSLWWYICLLKETIAIDLCGYCW